MQTEVLTKAFSISILMQGANQAAAAGKLGYPTVFIGQVGDDANAELLKTALEDASVDLSHLEVVKGSSGSAIILLQPSGIVWERDPKVSGQMDARLWR